jgi:hypothetical protein
VDELITELQNRITNAMDGAFALDILASVVSDSSV